jgi:glycyl-tRNA synthetase
MSKETARDQRMEKLVSLCKRRGFIFQSSEIYGGWNGFWDYGPLGAELKRNLRDTWWQAMVRERDDIVGLDASIILHPGVWKASGHVDTFNDPMCSCRHCQKLVRADQVRSMLGETRWFPALLACYDETTGLADRTKLAKFLPREGAQHAPNLAVVRDFEGVFQRFEERRKSAGAPLTAWEFVESMATMDFAATGWVTPCPHCGGELGEPRPFNLMLKTHTGPIASEENVSYLRPETAQAIFAQFKNVYDSSRVRVPFGIAQIGKAFRNEITPRNFTFRSREFEQMELEFFILPDEAIEILHGRVTPYTEGMDLSKPQPDWGWEVWHRYWLAQRVAYYASIGLGEDVLDYYWQTPEELAHYARATVDILFAFPFGTEELEGIAARGNFDLSQHQMHSGKSQEVFDEDLKNAAAQWDEAARTAFIDRVWARRRERQPELPRETVAEECGKLFLGNFIPHVIEPSAGLDRLALAVLAAAFVEETVTDAKGKPETRTVLRLHPRVAPVKVAVFPLLKNRPELVEAARRVQAMLRPHMATVYDESGAIGRRYRRQDEVGTPFCVTIDFDTIGENGPELTDTVTLRHRDSMEQERIALADLLPRLRAAGC